MATVDVAVVGADVDVDVLLNPWVVVVGSDDATEATVDVVDELAVAPVSASAQAVATSARRATVRHIRPIMSNPILLRPLNNTTELPQTSSHRTTRAATTSPSQHAPNYPADIQHYARQAQALRYADMCGLIIAAGLGGSIAVRRRVRPRPHRRTV